MIELLGRLLCGLRFHRWKNIGRLTGLRKVQRCSRRICDKKRAAPMTLEDVRAMVSDNVEDVVDQMEVETQERHQKSLGAARRIAARGPKCSGCSRRGLETDKKCFWCETALR